MTDQIQMTPNPPLEIEGLTPQQKGSLEGSLASFASDVQRDPNSDWEKRFVVTYVNSLLKEKNAEIARLNAKLDSIRAARDEAQEVLSVLNRDPAVATFQIAAAFQTMGNKVGRILQDGQS